MRYLFTLSFVLIIISHSISQRWYTLVEKEVGVNTAFRVEFVLENSRGGNFKSPDFSGFKVLSGPGQSSSTQIINGRSSSKQSFYYDLFAAKEGTFFIGPASIQVNGKLLKTEQVAVKVVKGEDIAGMLSSAESDILLKLELSDSVAYPGQQVMLRYTLYDDGTNRYNGIVDDDSFEEMFIKHTPSTQRPKVSVQNGKKYQSRVVSNIAIFSQKSGVFPIKEATAKVGVPLENSRPSGFFSFQRYSTRFVTSNNATLRVVDLPDGAPDSFNGAVGRYTLEGSINKQSTTTDDAVILNLTVKGNGDNRMVEAPELITDESWEVYEPTVIDENEYLEDNQIYSYKTFEYILLPKKTGRLSVRSAFSYYDTDSAIYRTITTNPVLVNVTQGNRKVLEDDSQVLSDRAVQGPMIHFNGHISKKNPFTSWPYLSFVFLTFIGAFILFKRKMDVDSYYALSPEERKRREALQKAKSSLSNAKSFMDKSASKEFYEEVSLAMNGFIADKYNLEQAEISKQKISKILESRFGDYDIPEAYLNILKQCELALFANQDQNNFMQGVYQSSLELISKIESIG